MRSALPYWFSIFLQERTQGLVICCIPRHHFVSEGKALRGHHQCNYHLYAVIALVAAVAIPALVRCIGRRIGFEIGAREVVQQNVKAGCEQVLPALTQMAKQLRLVHEQLVEAAIERILLDQCIILPEKVSHGALCEP